MRIAIIGAGVVGKAVGEAFRHHGHQVMYIDKRPERGASWMIYRTARRFDVAMICVDVPTISNPPIGQSINQIKGVVGEALKNADHVVIKSAVLPGTTDALRELFNTDAIHVNPEFLRERYAKQDALEPLLIVGDDADLMYALYDGFEAPIYIFKPIECEWFKYLWNLYNAMRISFFNEMRRLIPNAQKLIEALCRNTWHYRVDPLMFGGYDWGAFKGKCLPKDCDALYYYLYRQGKRSRFLEATIETNVEMGGVSDAYYHYRRRR